MNETTASINKIAELIENINIAMLTTKTIDGQMHSRPMTTQAHQFDGDVWFFSRLDTEVVQEIINSPTVNVAYADVNQNTYVSVAGQARIVKDANKKAALWKNTFSQWFDGDSPDSPEIVLIHVKAISAQYWDSPSSFIGKTVNWVKVMLSGDPQEAGESKQVRLA